MKFQVRAEKQFKQQLQTLDPKTVRIINKKVELIQKNPYRYKSLHNTPGQKAFRVRLNIQNKEARLIYIVKEPDIRIVAIIWRKDEYKDLEMHLKKLLEEEE